MAKDERVIFSTSRGSLVLQTRMAASGAHDCTSYLSSVIVCRVIENQISLLLSGKNTVLLLCTVREAPWVQCRTDAAGRRFKPRSDHLPGVSLSQLPVSRVNPQHILTEMTYYIKRCFNVISNKCNKSKELG